MCILRTRPCRCAAPTCPESPAMPEFVDPSPPGECLFCKLIAGQIPSSRVYEDERTVAFMDLGQVNPGHVLVATRRHAATLLDTTPEDAGAAMQTARRIARAAQAAFAPAGFTVLQANGAVAGQTVRHFHLHVLPRHEGDSVDLAWPRKEPGPEALNRYAEQLRHALTQADTP